MAFICLQAGHEGRTSGATGAPGEIELNVRIRNRLSDILQAKGFMIQLVAADPTDVEIKKDFDLFLALHGDANIYGTGGGCVGSGDPSVDASWARSADIKNAIISEYFHHSEIVNHPERVTAKMTKYYMWSRLTAKTPCVIIEMGVVQDPHDKVLLADTERIAAAIARGVCKAFGVSYEVLPPEPPPVETCEQKLSKANERISILEKDLSEAISSKNTELAAKDAECQQKLASNKLQFKADLEKFAKEY